MTNSTAVIIFTQFKNNINNINIIIMSTSNPTMIDLSKSSDDDSDEDELSNCSKCYLTLDEKLRLTAAEQECIDNRKCVFNCLSKMIDLACDSLTGHVSSSTTAVTNSSKKNKPSKLKIRHHVLKNLQVRHCANPTAKPAAIESAKLAAKPAAIKSSACQQP